MILAELSRRDLNLSKLLKELTYWDDNHRITIKTELEVVELTNNNKQVKLVQPDDLLVSKTDPQGNITYCNSNFLIYSGYSSEELIGKAMFSIAHTDMPQSIIRHIWSELKNFDEVCSLVKTQSKDGESYWTFLNATPSFDSDSQLIGHFFVQRSASAEAISYFEAMYGDMHAEESKSHTGISVMDASFQILDDVAAAQGGHNEFVFSYYA